MKFSQNFAAILQHNSEQVLGLHTYQLGLNEYADLVSIPKILRLSLHIVINYRRFVDQIFQSPGVTVFFCEPMTLRACWQGGPASC